MPEKEKLLEKSEKFLADAKSALNQNMSLETVQNRIYYSMFLSAKAALLTENIDAGTHSKVNRHVGKVFVKEKGILDEEMGRFYFRQQILREQADYDPETSFNRKDIEESLEKASEFIQKMKEICRK